MNSNTPSLGIAEESMTAEFPELSDFERQVQWSEFVPSPMRFLLMSTSSGLSALAE